MSTPPVKFPKPRRNSGKPPVRKPGGPSNNGNPPPPPAEQNWRGVILFTFIIVAVVLLYYAMIHPAIGEQDLSQKDLFAAIKANKVVDLSEQYDPSTGQRVL